MNGNRQALSHLPSPRRLALQCLRSIEQRSGFSNKILDEQVERYPSMDRRDRGLATLLVYGVLRQRQRLDAHIFAVAHQPRKLKGELLCALRIACFELLELDRPVAIASSQAALALKKIDPQGRLRPVLGAMLRNLDQSWRERESTWTSPADHLTLRHSIPSWLADKWQRELGLDKATARAQAFSQIPWIDLRIARRAGSRDALAKALQADYPQAEIELPAHAETSIRIRGAGDLAHGPLFQSGQFSVQGLGSQKAALALCPAPGERILDACCGMGSKTMQILEAMQGQGRLVAADENASRLSQVKVQQARLGLQDPSDGFWVQNADLCEHDSLLPKDRKDYDAILLDAPCTGLGNLARHPELRWTSSAKDIHDRQALQRKLLVASLTRLRCGGRLVYAVCSLEAQEGPEHMAWLQAQDRVSGYKVHLEDEQSWTPEDHACDGLYLAKLSVS